MRIHEFTVAENRIDHIAQHDVTPEEIEEVCFGKAFVQRAKSEGNNPIYYVLGQTEAGRYLFCVVIRFPDGQEISHHGSTDDGQRKTAIQSVEKPMNHPKIPQTDSIEELARFWDTHDLTDFEDELEEVTEPVFEHSPVVKLITTSRD